MLLNQASAATTTSLVPAKSAANTAAATTAASGWLDVRQYDGELLIVQNVGALTGSVVGKLQGGTSASGANAVDIPGAVFTLADEAGVQSIAIDPKAVTGGFLGYVGTIATGPALVSVTASGKRKVV